MNIVATKIEEYLSKVSPIKRYFIRNVAKEYYIKGYKDGKELSNEVILKGTTLREFIDLLNYYGIKFNRSLKSKKLVLSIRSDKTEELQKLIDMYKKSKNG